MKQTSDVHRTAAQETNALKTHPILTKNPLFSTHFLHVYYTGEQKAGGSLAVGRVIQIFVDMS
jgi:hypothetical protein